MSVEKKDSIKNKLFDIFVNFRFLVLAFFVLISFVTINFSGEEGGVVINGITPNSPAENAGMSYEATTAQRSLERIIAVGLVEINDIDEYYSEIAKLEDNSSIRIVTDKSEYGYQIKLDEIDGTVSEAIGISVRVAPTSNIKLGIELEGGSRLILKPSINLSDDEFNLLVNNLQSRLDVYGASGTKVNKLEDAFSNEKFVFVESINANKNDIFELIKRAGEFEARLNNQTVFTGENVLRVLNDPNNEIFQGCSDNAGFVCTYAFSIEIDSDGGDNFFNVAKELSVTNGYLSEQIEFYLDGELITALNVASSFKYNKITSPQITVSGNNFPNEDQAIDSAKKEMRFLQAILSTQSLPSELEVVSSYSISSSLGKSFLDNAIIVGITSLFIVSAVIALRYKQPLVFLGIFVALATEVIIVFGAAAFLRLSIDLAAIGGLIAAIGTGVDDQVIITDEYFRKKNSNVSSRKKIKNAIYIIMIAYFTTLAAMIPLYFAGLKILQGFAFMIIIGVTVGVFITRPAYAAYLRHIMTTRAQRKEEDENQ